MTRRSMVLRSGTAVFILAGAACVQPASASAASGDESAIGSGAADAIPASSSGVDSGAASSGAGDSADEAGGLQEITVTAEKRSSDTQRTAAAVTAIGGDHLQALGITDNRGFETVIPSAVFKQSGSVTQTFIRGVGSNLSLPAVDPGVSFNVNGVYLPREVGSNPLFDIERVEVLPGPQGTLWGHGAAGGAINVITNAPTRELGGSGLLEVGNYGEVHTTLVGNFPLSDSLAVRAAVDAHRHDGYLSNGGNDDKGIGGRVTVAYNPSNALSVLLYGNYYAAGGIGPVSITTNPFLDPNNHWYAATNTNGLFQKIHNYLVNGEINYDLGSVKVTYIPAYLSAYVNLSIGSGPLARGIPGLGNNPLHQQIEETQNSHELRIANSNPGKLNWVGGLYYDYFTERFLQATPAAVAPFNFTNTTNIPKQANTSYAAFGQATWSLTDWLRLTGGGRISSDKKDLPIGYINIGGVQTPISANHTWGKFDWKAGIEADIAPRSMVYLTVQTGGVPGGYAQAPKTPTFDNIVRPEALKSYTAGIKNRFLDNRLEVNNEVFYYDYDNYQVTALLAVAHTNVLLNAQKTKIYGDQLDVRLLLTPQDQIAVSLGLLSAKYTEFVIPGNPPATYSGYTALNAPARTLNMSYSHDWTLPNQATLTGLVQSSYNSGEYTNFNHTPGNYQPAFTKTNVSLTYYSPSKSWNVGAYVKNAENSWVLGAVGPGFGYLEEPRTYGVRLAATF